MSVGRNRAIALAAAVAVAVGIGFLASADQGTTTGSVTYSGLPPGNHTFEVRAIDAAGNVDPTPAVASWEVVVENTAPQATATWHQDTATVSVNAGGDIKEVLFYVNGVMASRKTTIPYERRTAKTGNLTLKESIREMDGDVAVTTLRVTR